MKVFGFQLSEKNQKSLSSRLLSEIVLLAVWSSHRKNDFTYLDLKVFLRSPGGYPGSNLKGRGTYLDLKITLRSP